MFIQKKRAAFNAVPQVRILVVLIGMGMAFFIGAASNNSAAAPTTDPSGSPVQTAIAQHEIVLFKGEVRVIDVPGTIKRIAVGDGTLVSSTVADRQLVLLAEKPGVTSLVIWNQAGIAMHARVRVTDQDLSDTAEQLRITLAPFVRKLEVMPRGNSIIVRGFVHPERKDDAKAVVERYRMATNLIQAEDGGPLKKAVMFKVHIMEITKIGMENIGIAWDQQINGPQASVAGNAVHAGRYGAIAPITSGSPYDSVPGSVSGATGGVFLGIATSIFSRINLAVSNGEAYLLAAPELNTRSGGTASFLAGGEVPIPIAGALGSQTVIYKEYGIRLDVKPAVDGDNVITTTLGTEISQIDPSLTVQGYPAFLTRRTSSELTLRPGETVALSGLVQSQASDAVDRVPLLGNLPILGRLFRSANFRSSKSDLVIFVTPLLYDPNQPEPTDLLDRGEIIERNYRYKNGDPSPLLEIDRRREKEIDNHARHMELLGQPEGDTASTQYRGG